MVNPINQARWPGQMVKQDGKAKWASQVAKPNDQAKWLIQMTKPSSQATISNTNFQTILYKIKFDVWQW